MNERFARRLAAAGNEVRAVAADDASRRRLLYRRAVPTERRSGAAAPGLPVAGLRIASNRVAVLVPEEFSGGRFDAAAVDAALHAARVAGAEWAAAWVSAPADVAVLRDLAFQPMADGPDAQPADAAEGP